MAQPQTIPVKSLNEGLDLRNDPASPLIPEGRLKECIGADITDVGLIKTATGYGPHDLSGLAPPDTEIVIWCQKVYMGNQPYYLVSTQSGLWINGTNYGWVSSRFKALAVAGNIYILTPTGGFRFDGTALYKWGIAGPDYDAVPSIVEDELVDLKIEDFEDLTGFNFSDDIVASLDNTYKKEGTYSLKAEVTPVAGVADSGSGSWTLSDATATFVTDGVEAGDIIWNITLDKQTTVLSVASETALYTVGLTVYWTENDVYAIFKPKTYIKKNIVIDLTKFDDGAFASGDEKIGIWILANHFDYITAVTLQFDTDDGTFTSGLFSYRDTNIHTQTNDIWWNLEVAKSLFTKYGTNGWDKVRSFRILIEATAAVDIYFDICYMKHTGGLSGDYYFMFGYARTDDDGNVIHYGKPSPTIIGPLTLNGQKIAWTGRPASSDPQVNAQVIYIAGGTLSGWWVGHVILDNLTTPGNIYLDESLISLSMTSLNNNPCPGGNNMTWWKDRIWIAAPPDDRSQVRASNITSDGIAAYEAFPYLNGLIFNETGGELLSIHELNSQLAIRGRDGQFTIVIADPTDLKTVDKNQPSYSKSAGVDAFMIVNNNLVFPTIDAFILSNGMSAQAILPEIAPIVQLRNLDAANGIYRGFEGFFSLKAPDLGDITMKVDLLTGSPRMVIHSKYAVDCFMLDDITNKVYAVIDGKLYLYDSGYTANGDKLTLKVKTKAYSLGVPATWKQVQFKHNTGGSIFVVRAFLDDVELGFKTFTSTRLTDEMFTFGPASGMNLQIQFESEYDAYGVIRLPMRIYLDG